MLLRKIVRGQVPPRQLPPRKIDLQTIVPEENCPLTIKFPSKIIVPIPANSLQRALQVK